MPRSRSVNNSFTSGELDPLLHERYDTTLHAAGCAELKNFLIVPQGGVKRRPGYRHVAFAKNATASRLIPFVFSATDGVILEAGTEYFRFFADNGQVVDGTPVEVETPYDPTNVSLIHYAQAGDTLILTDGAHSARELVRLDPLTWQLRFFRPTPPPTFEAGFQPSTTLTLSATIGQSVTATAGTAIFLDSDVDRAISQSPAIGTGFATIIEVVSPTVVTLAIVDAFSSTSLLTDEWQLDGSPVAQLTIDKGFPIGARALLTLQREQDDATELVTNGTFAAGLTGWTDSSGGLLSSGTVDAVGSSDIILNDTTTPATFQTDGVLAGHRVLDTTNSLEDSVAAVTSETQLSTTAGGADWTGGTMTYEVRRTGTITVVMGQAQLSGGPQGVAQLEQGFFTTPGVTYRVTFSVSGQTLSLAIGTTSQGSELVAEFSYPVDNENVVTFTATTVTSFLTFRNNQNFVATLDNVSVKQFDIDGWRATDVGKYVRVNEGIVQITVFVNPTQVRGVVRKSLTDTLDALAGAWSLEENRWTAARGFPHTVAFYGSRLCFSNTTETPARTWASRLNVYRDFGTGIAADDAAEFEVAATEINPIQWLVGERSLLLGTIREEFSIRGQIGRTFTPTDIDVDSPSHIGSDAIQPIRAQRAVLFVQRGSRRIREITSEAATEENRRNSDLSIRAEHLTRMGIRNIAFQQEPDTVLWVVTENDELRSMTYLQEHIVFGWSDHPTSLDVLDVAVIPHPDGDRDQVWLLTRLPGQSLPSIGYLDDAAGFYGQLMVDAGITGTFDPPTSTVSGLDHLEGQVVTVLTDGYEHPSRTVVDGEITLQQAATDVEVGLPFTPRLVTLRPTYQSTPLSGLYISNIRIFASLLDTINAVINGERVTFTDTTQSFDTAPPLFTGVKEVDTTGWDVDGQVVIEQDKPYPITIRSISRTLDVEEP